MKKLAKHIVVFSLLPCLFVDTSLAANMTDTPLHTSPSARFSENALTPPIISALHTYHRPLTVALGMTAGWLLSFDLHNPTLFLASMIPATPRKLSAGDFNDERTRVLDFLDPLPRAVVIFGSARTPPGDSAYELAREFGRILYRYGMVPRTGAGPSMMEAPMRGYIEAREAAGAGRTFENMTQGVKILLPFETMFNDYVEHRHESDIFVMRKMGLHRKTIGAVAMPGGFGTLDEIFEVMQRGRPLVLLEPKEGPLAGFWTQIFDGFEDAWKWEGLQLPERPLITNDPEIAARYLLQAQPKAWQSPAISVPEANDELDRGYRKLEEEEPASVVLVGRPQPASATLDYARQLTHSLLERGLTVRIGSRAPLLNAILNTKLLPGTLKQHLQAVLFIPPGEDLRTNEKRQIARIVSTHDQANHQVLVTKRANAYYFLPGTKQTANRVFDLLQLMQVGKMERRPMYLIGEEFWKRFLGPAIKMMLLPIPIMDPKTGMQRIHALTGNPETYSMISPGDEQLLVIANGHAEIHPRQTSTVLNRAA